MQLLARKLFMQGIWAKVGVPYLPLALDNAGSRADFLGMNIRQVFTKGRFTGSPQRNIAAQGELKAGQLKKESCASKNVQHLGCTLTTWRNNKRGSRIHEGPCRKQRVWPRAWETIEAK